MSLFLFHMIFSDATAADMKKLLNFSFQEARINFVTIIEGCDRLWRLVASFKPSRRRKR